MANISIFYDKRRKLSSGAYPIRIRVYHRGTFYINTGVEATEDSWSANQVSSKDRLYKTKNARIMNRYTQVNKEILNYELAGTLHKLSDDQLKAILNGDKFEKVVSLIDYFAEYMDTLDKARTKEIYFQTQKKIELFDRLTTINDVSIKWLESFEAFLKRQKLATNTISIHLRNIRAVFNYCLDNEYIDTYPFRKFKIKREKTPKRALSIEELRLLKDYPVEPHQERYRDIFMLSFFLLGINMVDLLHLTPDNVIKGRIEFRRAKTNRLYSIKIPDEAKYIIEKWRGEKYLINIMDTYVDYKNFIKLINKHLKHIGPMRTIGRGGKKKVTPLFPNISTYWARHTWATIAASLDIPKETISHALGHGNDTVTDIYIDFDLSKVDEANRRVIEYLLRQHLSNKKS